MKSSIEQYLLSVAGKQIDVDWVYWHQCVDLAKHFASNVWNRPLGSFGGSAKTWWDNSSQTFPDSDFIKIENDISNPNQVPSPWDMVFFNIWEYWHVAIILEAPVWQNKIRVIEQNVGNWDGQWYDDRVVVWEYKYTNVLWWYKYRKFFSEYEWINAYIRPQPATKPTRNAMYVPISEWWPYFVFYPHFFTKTQEQQEAIKEHEYSHYVDFEHIPNNIRKKWEEMSNFTINVRIKFLSKWKFYTNGYVSTHASKSPSEDFAECWEYYKLRWNEHENPYVKIKIDTAVELMRQYDPREQ